MEFHHEVFATGYLNIKVVYQIGEKRKKEEKKKQPESKK